ncbi:hypothetical protein V0U79_09535 [Hyphobacterium sp. HN65]|uniref:DUF2219 domain-containing protein n=1 Tax=Hyphobacterium lacteum TaxID=3116575 RepID=A0ABU7LRR4_9PROT|nr:hypothetical protein [Hyphobacterium sp. HN65]MEE2526608.1 hypothetical protein [Hyphobacterium sp. HN65]
MRRTTEILCAGCVAVTGLCAGLAGPAVSDQPEWDPHAAVLASFENDTPPSVSSATARTATAVMSVRQAYSDDFGANRTRFVLADPPGPGEIVLEGETLTEEAFQRASFADLPEARTTTNVRLAAPVANPAGDTVVTPYAGVSLTPEGTEARVGARLRIGDGRGSDSRWYLFAAAERQALFYDANAIGRPLQAIDVTPYTVIGDAQGGVAYRVSDSTDIAFAYVRRSWAYRYGVDEWEEDEDFAAISIVSRW